MDFSFMNKKAQVVIIFQVGTIFQNPNLPGKYSWPLHGGKSEVVGCSGRFKGKLL